VRRLRTQCAAPGSRHSERDLIVPTAFNQDAATTVKQPVGLQSRRRIRLTGDRGEQRESREQPGTIHHWITSSARSKSDFGMVMPSAAAVLTLITSSNLVGRSIDRSPGLAPFRIRST
jgi:hypothetical protein